MSTKKTCLGCGAEYEYNHKMKGGTTTRLCRRCARREAKETTLRQMVIAAGSCCRACGYDKCPSAITFIDPVERIDPEPKPKNRQEKVQWASGKVAICNRCKVELDNGLINMQVKDATSVPVDVFFYVDSAVEPVSHGKKLELKAEDTEVYHGEEIEGLKQAKGREAT